MTDAGQVRSYIVTRTQEGKSMEDVAREARVTSYEFREFMENPYSAPGGVYMRLRDWVTKREAPEAKSVPNKTVSALMKTIRHVTDQKGFHQAQEELDPKVHILNTRLLLAVSELVEAMDVLRFPDNYWAPGHSPEEAHRVRMANFGEELADAVIRVFDTAEVEGLDLESIILQKIEKNRNRPRLHNKRF